ncbi:MAG: hypothetical protein ACREO7_06400 [Pseudoxanthomonas sp.]
MHALAAIAMLLWPWLDAELLQNALAGIVLVIAVVSLPRVATARKRSTASVLPMICMAALAFALTARNEVAKASDAYADGFIKRHSCRPTFADLSAAHEGWEQDRGPMLLELRKFGAVRTISYQQNGLLRFGFLYDDSRSVWLPECGAA